MSLEKAKTAVEISMLVVGHLWAIGSFLLGFFLLKQREKAAADLEKTQEEIRKTQGEIRKIEPDLRKTQLESQQKELEIRRVELDLRHIAVVRTDMSAASFRRPDGPGYCIVVDVDLTNNGKRPTRIEWGEKQGSGLFVRPASFSADGTPSFLQGQIHLRPRQARDANAEVVSTILRVGATEHLAFAVHVEHPGVYLLSFRAPLASEEQEVAKDAGAHYRTSWTTHRYVIVAEAPSNETTTRPAA